MAVNTIVVADNVAVTNGTPLYSQAVSMDGANTILPSVVVFTLGGATGLKIEIEGSNDLSNWGSVSTPSSWTSTPAWVAGFNVNSPTFASSIAWQYVRLKYTVFGTGTVIFSASLSTAQF